MKLFYSPLACSLADHIALQEAAVDFELERVDLATKTTTSGRDFRSINPKGYVPALELEEGLVLTENVALLDWIAQRFPDLGVAGELGRSRLLEALTFISTELHGNFKPVWHARSADARQEGKNAVSERLQLVDSRMDRDYLFGPGPTVADFYLFVMLLWCEKVDIELPARLRRMKAQMMNRPAVRVAMADEGLL